MKLIDRLTGKDQILKEVQSLKAFALEQQNVARIFQSQAAQATRELKEATEKWLPLGAGTDTDRALDDSTRNDMRQKCIQAYYRSPEGRAIIKNLTSYIVGTGIDYTCQDENPKVQEFLDSWVYALEVRFDQRQMSIIRRALRDGEVFVHLIFKRGFSAMRFYSPGEIVKINTDPNDAEKTLSYEREWKDSAGKMRTEIIDAKEIHHIRLEVDEDVERGRPLLEPVLKRLAQYEDWLEGRIKVNKSKSSIFLERIVDGSPARVAAVASSFPGVATGNFDNDPYAVQAPRYGTVVTHSKAVEWKWVEPHINAADCAEDGRQIRLSIAAGVQLPEFILTSDASNANYSSTMISESPFIKSVEGFRFFFEQEFKAIFARTISWAIETGILPKISTETVMTEAARRQVRKLKAAARDNGADLKEQIAAIAQDSENTEEIEVPTKTEVDIQWPSIITRNLWEETQSVSQWFENGWISKESAQMRFGLDPDEEARKIEREKESEPEEGEEAYQQMQGEVGGLEDQEASTSEVVGVEEGFPGHKGRPGQRGGSLPKGAARGAAGAKKKTTDEDEIGGTVPSSSGQVGATTGVSGAALLGNPIKSKVPKRLMGHERTQAIGDDFAKAGKEISPFDRMATYEALMKFTGLEYGNIRAAGMGRKSDFADEKHYQNYLFKHQKIDSWVSLSTLKTDAPVFRGLKNKADVFEKANIGDTWQSKSVSSWSAESKVARKFAGDTMLVLKGGPARGRDISSFSTVPREREFLMSSQNSFRIVGKERVGKMLVVTLEAGG